MDPSPFTSRLNSNYVPTDSESLEIQTLLKLPTSRLEDLSTQLHELDDQSTQLRNEHSSLLLFISKHRALISLIRKLPINILQEIFIACLPAAHNAVMSRWEPPILLTQICSSWRKVALATPRLWKSIHIAVPGNRSGSSREHPSATPRRVELIHRRSEAVLEWLSRSATCPLDISLGQLDRFGDSTLDGFDKIIDYLIRFSERWRNIRLSAPSIALLPVAALPPSKVPLLETLFLNCLIGSPQQYDYRRDPQSIWMTSGVLKAPKLRELWLHSMWLSLQRLKNPEDLTRLPINWSKLTNISLIEGMFSGAGQFALTVPRAYKLLSLCPNLITCRLEIGMTITYEEEPPLETTAALISLPFLTSLLVVENSSLSGLFTLLRLPSLSCIEFRTTIRFTYQATTSLLSLLTHSHNTIQLIADTRFFMRKDFIKCLRLCPLLKSLSIRKSTTIYPHSIPITLHSLFRIDDAFLKLFIESSNDDDDDDEGYLCPHLEDFEISIDTAFSETTLLQFVKKKNGDSNNSNSSYTGLARLKRLSVVFYCRPQSDISINQELEPYEQATGLVATITYPPTAFFSAFGGLPGYLPSY